jgi:hypothetical protein
LDTAKERSGNEAIKNATSNENFKQIITEKNIDTKYIFTLKPHNRLLNIRSLQQQFNQNSVKWQVSM